MKPETIQEIKAELLRIKQETEEALKVFATKDSGNANDFTSTFPDYGEENDENAQEVGQYSTNIATENILEKTLRDVKSALKKIDQNTYGICKYCHKEIDEKRLLARPFSSSCVKCKSQLQKN
ncbi:MAG TPA: TraR/DksA family transcriptional regulator [bacterium]|mgnify:CR=1 FL=1|jgi:DnaK suppressor protein|nr:TraR/DksA family transcriptional regulator [bacterium]HNZ51437.1 TraR/DksA family transcriptional regulator [bacterium]HOF79382.1 TraR/DksA family transcriptional regulator [bacterium]HOH85594.1 TraR/DksA family transcriptional regulator [bacterium]HOQ91495.1 TraR/DksA family transcriptional regulator [bacterium]